MNPLALSRQAALHYLQTPLGASWCWQERSCVIAWSDGTTVAFRQEVNEILRSLAPNGLPSFNELVILLAACRGKFPAAPVPEGAPANTGERDGLLQLFRVREHKVAVGTLALLQQFPSHLIAETRGKSLLAAAVFEASTRFSLMESAAIEQGLDEHFGDEELNTLLPGAAPVDAVQALRNVSAGVRRHTADSLQRRLRTGLDTLPVEAPALELPAQEQAHRLLTALAASDHLAGLALVVRDLMAAIHLPRVIARAEDVPNGGASDLGNRGTLDRLLISELAYDDLTLATRVALNEALYLRREPPARRPERALAILLDSGLRMWGIPRVLATASAIALVARHRSTRPAEFWRAGNTGLVPLSLLSQSGLEDHLAVLETYLHPAAALSELQRNLADAPDVDVVVATHRDALADVAFQARLAEAHFQRGFLLAVDRDGSVELHSLPWGLPRPIAKVQIDVARLFAPSAAKGRPLPLIDPANLSDFPAIFREPLFPLFLPVQSKLQQIIPHQDGGVCITSDRRLFRWDKPSLGARQLLADLPGSRTSWLGCDSKGRIVAVRTRGKDGKVCVVVIPSESDAPRITHLRSSLNPLAVWLDQEVLLIALPKVVVAVSIVTGEILAEMPYPEGCDWINGRYFRDATSLSFASWTGHIVRWDSLPASRAVALQAVFTVFDVKGVGPWLLTKDGRILSPVGHEVAKTGLIVRDVRISPEGERLVVLDAVKGIWQILSLKDPLASVRPLPAKASSEINPGANFSPPTRTLQNHFSAIAVTDRNCIRLCTTKGKWLETFAFPERLVLVSSISDHKPSEAAQQPFVAITTPTRFGCTLKRARWPNGSTAWLDSRGLLHLRSHDRTVPEITLALFHSSLAAWCSNGLRAGPAFFHGADHEAKPVQQVLEQFCQRLC